jgi:hypothetical protein
MPFKNVGRLGNDNVSNLLEINLKYWLSDAFLRIGNIIPLRTTVLTPDTSDNITNLMVWNSNIQGWAPSRIDNNNIVVTPATVTVNGVTDPNVTINYSKGQVTFTGELLPDDKVQARHYTNQIGIYTVLELNRRPMVRLGSTGSEQHGDYTIFQEMEVSETIRAPYIIIETFRNRSRHFFILL